MRQRLTSTDLSIEELLSGKRPLVTTAVSACWGAPDRV